MPKVSIIMPVYKAERYLRVCLDSILSQSFSDWECILVDDASPDASGEIIEEYVRGDHRFRAIHKPNNEGVSMARQTGLDHATGDYVIHADPDDRTDVDWLKELYEKAESEHADMVICDFERIYADNKVIYRQCPTSLNTEDILEDLLMKRIWGSCWNKLVRRECFRQHQISFHPQMNLWEDLYVTCKLLMAGIKVAYVPKVLYYYDSVSNQNSLVMYRKMKHVRSAMIFIDEISPQLIQERYVEGWFRVKKTIKTWLFRIHASKQDMAGIYEEINGRLISEAKGSSPFSLDFCLALSIKGYPTLAHLIYGAPMKLRKKFFGMKKS